MTPQSVVTYYVENCAIQKTRFNSLRSPSMCEHAYSDIKRLLFSPKSRPVVAIYIIIMRIAC